jgi:hypothetical protein
MTTALIPTRQQRAASVPRTHRRWPSIADLSRNHRHRDRPFERIALITDPAMDDPAVAVASQIGAHVGALELICCSPNRARARVDRIRLERIAARP